MHHLAFLLLVVLETLVEQVVRVFLLARELAVEEGVAQMVLGLMVP